MKLLNLNKAVTALSMNALVTAFVFMVLYLSFDLPPLAGNLPLIISSITLVLFAIVSFENVKSIREDGLFVDVPEDVQNRRKRLLAMVGWCLFLTIAVVVLGIYVGFLLFLPAYTYRKANLRPQNVAVYSVVLWVIIMAIFSRLLNRQLYNGLVPIVPEHIVRFLAGF